MRFFDTTRYQGFYRTRSATGGITVVLAWLIAALATSSASFAKTLHIIHTNDLHGRLIQERIRQVSRALRGSSKTPGLRPIGCSRSMQATPSLGHRSRVFFWANPSLRS